MLKLILALLIFQAFLMVAQDEHPKPAISYVPLTGEQIDIYRAVLKDYSKGSDVALNIARMTHTFNGYDQPCLQGMELPAKPVIHHLGHAIALNPRMVLVDPTKPAFPTGLFTFSEIVFNKQHTRAILQYSFVCGGLCGNGDTVVLKKANGKWKITGHCRRWISQLQKRRARSSELAVF